MHLTGPDSTEFPLLGTGPSEFPVPSLAPTLPQELPRLAPTNSQIGALPDQPAPLEPFDVNSCSWGLGLAWLSRFLGVTPQSFGSTPVICQLFPPINLTMHLLFCLHNDSFSSNRAIRQTTEY